MDLITHDFCSTDYYRALSRRLDPLSSNGIWAIPLSRGGSQELPQQLATSALVASQALGQKERERAFSLPMASPRHRSGAANTDAKDVPLQWTGSKDEEKEGLLRGAMTKDGVGDLTCVLLCGQAVIRARGVIGLYLGFFLQVSSFAGTASTVIGHPMRVRGCCTPCQDHPIAAVSNACREADPRRKRWPSYCQSPASWP